MRIMFGCNERGQTMKREIITRHSEALDEDMNVIVYGDGGYPVVVFQVRDGKCNTFEDFGMIDALSDYIDDGVLQLFSVDSIDGESWSDEQGDKTLRARRQEDYFKYVTDELVPLVHEVNGTDRRPLAFGCALGATQAALAVFRRPDLFQGCIALSGIYDPKYYFGDWMDSVLYDNSLTAFLPNMSKDHPYVDTYSKRQLVLCVGQGAWEDKGVEDLTVIRDACREKGIDIWCDFWGDDVNHDWPWWRKQFRYFIPFVLEDLEKTTAAEAAEKKPAKKTTAKRATKATAAKATTTKAAATKTAEKKTATKAAASKAATKATATKAAASKTAAAKPAATKAAAAKPAAAKATTAKPAAEKAAPAAKATAAKPAATKAAPAAKPAAAKATAAKPAAAKATAAKPAAEKAAPATKASTTKAAASKTTAAKPAASKAASAKPAASKTTTAKAKDQK